ncbi:MAG: hypothetical protein JOY61_10490 [Chloroflexi bacterium]|nr:hypothetical protein [Chloroflexota bacterium]
MMAEKEVTQAKQLEVRVTELQTNLKSLADSDNSTLLNIIHRPRPGITTPAEWQFLGGMVENLIQQTNAMRDARQSLERAAQAISQG